MAERGQRLPGVQPAQEQPHAAGSQHAAARGAVPTELGRTSDPVQPQHPGRPDGISGRSPCRATGATCSPDPADSPRASHARQPRRQVRQATRHVRRPTGRATRDLLRVAAGLARACVARSASHACPAPPLAQQYANDRPCPLSPPLAHIDSPADLRRIPDAELPAVADESAPAT